MTRSGALTSQRQAAKVTPFAACNQAHVRKSAAGDFFLSLSWSARAK
jgi:hypothetical protein